MQYLVTITASPQSSCFNGYSKSGKYYSFYKKIVKYMNTFDNELVIEPQINGNPHMHLLFTTDETIENLKLFFEQFYPLLENPHKSPPLIWTKKTNYKYPDCIEYNFVYAIKIQQNFTNESDYLNKKKDNGFQEAAYQWTLDLQNISTFKYYNIFEKNNQTSKITKNQLFTNFDSYDYNKIKTFIDSTDRTQKMESCLQKCHITHINTLNHFPTNRIQKTLKEEYLEFLN